MTDKQNFEVNARFEYGTYLTPNAKGKNINAPSNRPDWRITLQADHIKRLEEELKAKEQECEELKEKLIKWLGKEGITQSEKEFYEEQLDQLKAENETLKQYKSSKQASYESMQREWNNAVNENRELKTEIETLKSFDINLVGIKECEIRQLVQYRKALIEIKEIVKEQLPTVNYNFAKSMHPEMFNCYEQILQKISECDVDNVASD
jgi:chromosome segregation ATPase